LRLTFDNFVVTVILRFFLKSNVNNPVAYRNSRLYARVNLREFSWLAAVV